MKRLVFVLIFGASLGAQLSAFASDCFLVLSRLDGDRYDVGQISPSNLTAALPPGFFITSIRNFTYVILRGDAFGEQCTRVTKLPSPISLDAASVYGQISISGKLKWRGVLRYESNDGGRLEFVPNKNYLATGGRFFQDGFTRLKLDEAMPTVSLSPPRQLKSANCWQAKAILEASGFSMLAGDSSLAGTYVEKAQLRDVSDFRRCQWGGP
jgi:hypothetical protein